MNFVKRFFYLIYYFRNLEVKKLLAFLKYSSGIVEKPRVLLFLDCIYSVFRFNISILDYFYFRFFELKDAERFEWAGTGFMFEFQLKMNPKKSRGVLSSKIEFLRHYNQFIKRHHADLETLQANNDILTRLLSNASGKLVLKNSKGQTGKEVEVVNCNDYSGGSLISLMKKKGYDLMEEYVTQHHDLMGLSASGLNTIRVITQLNNNDIDIIGCRLRVSVNSQVDNLAAGNIAAAVDVHTGIVTSPGIYSDITKPDQVFHPVTREEIPGFKVPYWDEVLRMAKQAALVMPENRSVGWDISITEEGPELIEGNHNWCKLLWQLPVKHGLKNELTRYL